MALPTFPRPMPRPAAIFALLAVLLLAAPAVSASLTVQDTFPVRGAWPFTPQIHCEFVLDSPAQQRCNAEGPGAGVNQIRARVVGSAHVRAYLADEGRPIPVSLGALDCVRSCVVPLSGSFDSSRFDLLVLVTGAPNSVVSVDVEMGLAGVQA